MQTLHECEAYHRTSHAYDSGIYHRSAEGCGRATKEMSIYSSIRLNDPLRDKVVLKRTPSHLSGVHLVTPL
jgi:hypothetical protein